MCVSACDWWAEVYLETESKWIYVNTVAPLVDQPDEADSLATRPMSYVLAVDNGNICLYSPNIVDN